MTIFAADKHKISEDCKAKHVYMKDTLENNNSCMDEKDLSFDLNLHLSAILI